MMGSGGMVVVDDTTCMVDFAKFFLKFTAEESCGKCVPCRVGSTRMLEILERISAGEADRRRHRPARAAWPTTWPRARSAPWAAARPTRCSSTLRYFKDEVMAHVVEHRCPAGVCRPLIRYRIDEDACTGCRACVSACPSGAITGERKQPHVIDQDALHQVRRLSPGLQVRRRPGGQRSTRAGRKEARDEHLQDKQSG